MHLDSNSQTSNFSLSPMFKIGRGIHGQASFVSLSPNMDLPNNSHAWSVLARSHLSELFSRVRAGITQPLGSLHLMRTGKIYPISSNLSISLLPRLLYLERGMNDPYSIRSTLPLLRYKHNGDRVDSFSQLTHTPCASTN